MGLKIGRFRLFSFWILRILNLVKLSETKGIEQLTTPKKFQIWSNIEKSYKKLEIWVAYQNKILFKVSQIYFSKSRCGLLEEYLNIKVFKIKFDVI